MEVLDYLQARPGRLRTQSVVRSSTGEPVVRELGHPVWLAAFLPGRLLADVATPEASHLRSLGLGLGDLDRRLSGFDHPAARRLLRWDIRRAPAVAPLALHIDDEPRRTAVRSRLERLRTEVLPGLVELPMQVIHNDANDHNVLVSDAGGEHSVGGLLDFGDMVWTARVCEPAIAMTYAMMSAPDPLDAGARVLAGYHEARSLARPEIRLIPDLIEARLCISVTMSAYRCTIDPDNAYLSVSEAPAWGLLEGVFTKPPSLWVEALEAACAGVRPMEPKAQR